MFTQLISTATVRQCNKQVTRSNLHFSKLGPVQNNT